MIAIVVSAATVVSPSVAAARTWHVPADAPSIQAGIDSSRAGDDVLVAPGQYLEHDVALKAGVWVHSEQGPDYTILDAEGVSRGFDCVDQHQETTLEGFEIRNGYASGDVEQDKSGGAVRCLDSRLTVRGCVITECSARWDGGGIYASGSPLNVEACRVSGCYARMCGGGIFAWCWISRVSIADCYIVANRADFDGGIAVAAQEAEIVGCIVSGNSACWGDGDGIVVSQAALTIRDCLIIDNGAAPSCEAQGLAIDMCTGVVEGCTVAGHGGHPCNAILVSSSNIRIERTIIAFNGARAVDCSYDSHVGWRCCDLYGNGGGSEICGDDLGGNFSEDPLFCDRQNGDYTLDANSPCLPGNHPQGVDCGLIGARDQGCGTPPPMGACCFLDGSCVVAEQHECGEEHGTYMGDGTTCDPNPCHPTRVRIMTWGRIKASFRSEVR